MSYVFDTSPLSVLFRNYYRNVFRRLWRDFDALVDAGQILSTREVLREIEGSPLEAMRTWADENKELFPAPTAEEAQVVLRIFAVPHFQNNIEGKKLLRGGLLADPFVIARASIAGASVVTMETLKPNAADIPNICQHFDIPCLTLESFMQAEGWNF
ncbi:MAG: DUF4411 family protein [Hyphomicrobiaceae bacterium]|nr:MAG: DUF4411 family protein [Hyphomicrobiaceae bacterium]